MGNVQVKRSLILTILVFLFIGMFPQNAEAAAPSLTNFSVQNSISASTFSDVKTADWFYSGIKTVYTVGIMEGLGNQRFFPNNKISMAEVITIASRMHAIYMGNLPPVNASGTWYLNYYNYAADFGFLPPSITNSTNLDKIMATRSEIACVFAQILSIQDLSPINDSAIPDLNNIDANYVDAVKTMYSAGIINGQTTDGAFQGSAYTTRAEIAAIISRMIYPFERKSHDRRYNPLYIGQEANCVPYYSIACEDDTYAYYVCYLTDRYGIVQNDKETNKSTILYRETDSNSLSPDVGQMLRYKNKLYFVEQDFIVGPNYTFFLMTGTLKAIDLDTKTVEIIYSGVENQKSIDDYVIYDDTVYASLSNDNRDQYDIVSITDKTAASLTQSNRNVWSIHCFNNKLYFSEGGVSELYEYDLETKTIRTLLSNIDVELMFENKLIFQDSKDDIYKTTLSDPEVQTLLFDGDQSKTGFLESAAYVNDTFYFNYSWLDQIYRIENGYWATQAIVHNAADMQVIDGRYIYMFEEHDAINNPTSTYQIYIQPIGSSDAMLLSDWLFHEDKSS